MRFLLREALRPLELPRLLSRGAFVEESLSTRLDSVRAPDRLWLDRERLDPEDPLRALALDALDRLFDPFERLFDPEDRAFDFEEDFRAPPLRDLLLVDRLRWAI